MTVTLPDGQHVADHADEIAATFAAVEKQVPDVRIIDEANTGDPAFRTKDGAHRVRDPVLPLRPVPHGRAEDDRHPRGGDQAAAPSGATIGVTGEDPLAVGDSETGPGVLGETLIGGLGALLVLIFVFASFLALLPIVVAAVSILATFLMLLPITYLTDVSFIVQFLIALVGLGVAIDYSLLVVTRWREERDHGRENHEAVVVAMQTAGHAVVFSGVTVAIGLIALIVLPVPFMRSMGYGGALIPLASVLTTLTLTPAILGGIGPKVDWPRVRHETAREPVLEPVGRARRPPSLDRRDRGARRPRGADRRVLRRPHRPGLLGLAREERSGVRGAADARERRRRPPACSRRWRCSSTRTTRTPTDRRDRGRRRRRCACCTPTRRAATPTGRRSSSSSPTRRPSTRRRSGR